MPDIPSIVWVLLLGAAVSIGALFQVSMSAANKAHKLEHAALDLPCPADTRITIIEGGKKTCLVENVHVYGTQKRYLKALAGKS